MLETPLRQHRTSPARTSWPAGLPFRYIATACAAQLRPGIVKNANRLQWLLHSRTSQRVYRMFTDLPCVTAAHVHVSRRDNDKGPIDDALAEIGLKREIAMTVGGFSAALALARASDLVATVHERHTGILFDGMFSFALPLPIPQFTVSLLWHPRLDGDPAHRWLRGCVRDVCAGQLQGQTVP